jgi:hypothetical protein
MNDNVCIYIVMSSISMVPNEETEHEKCAGLQSTVSITNKSAKSDALFDTVGSRGWHVINVTEGVH